ncbi:MAG: VWA domain-containing protein [Chloroflexi bacterium]|nr:VWA domain-containing protein [Chloroflexota bacterium]
MGYKGDCGLLTKESVAIPLIGVEVNGVITGRSAKVKVKQHFVNRDTSPVEAVYKFPLPESGAVCGFKAMIGDKIWEGGIEERNKAFKLYDEALAEGHGAYLLDEERPNIFTLSLGNLNPNTSAIIEIDYVIMLDTYGQEVRFFLPTTISPRYVPDNMEDEGGIFVGDIVNPVYAATVPYGLNVYLEIHGRRGVSAINSPSHSIITQFDGDSVKVEFSAQTVAMDRDFVLDITYTEEFQNRAFYWTRGDEKFIQIDFVPSLKVLNNHADSSKEIIFVLDCSGSMNGSSIKEAKQALIIFLKGMDASMRFNVYRFGSTFEKLFEMSKPYTQGNLETAVNYLSGVQADLGGTELLAPLLAIYQDVIEQDNHRNIILITDGQVGNETKISSLVQGHSQTTSLFTVGIGYGPNEYLIKLLARSSGGASECIVPGERIEPKVLRLFRKVMSGKINNCSVQWGFEVDQIPSMPIVYNGEAISIFAKVLNGTAVPNTLVIAGDFMNSRQEWVVSIKPVVGTDTPVSLLWARGKIEELEGGVASASGSKQVERKERDTKEAIIALSKGYGVLSKETSYVVVEKRPDAQGGTGDLVFRKIPVMLTKDWHGGFRAPARYTGIPSRIPYICREVDVVDVCHYATETRADRHLRRPSATTKRQELLLSILALQRGEGGFELDRAAVKVIGLSYANLEECAAKIVGQGKTDNWVLLSTVIVLYVLKKEFSDMRAMWYGVVQKSQKWYEAEASRVKPSIDGIDLLEWASHYIEHNKVIGTMEKHEA